VIIDSAFGVFNSLNGLVVNEKLKTTTPRKIGNEARIVKEGAKGRGGFIHKSKVSPNYAKLYWTTIDYNVKNTGSDSYGYTTQVIAEFDGEKFSYVNSKFKVMTSKAVYTELVNIGACEPNQDYSKPIEINIDKLPVFPDFNFDEQSINEYAEDKVNLIKLRARYETLGDFKGEHRKWFFSNNVTFDTLEPKKAVVAAEDRVPTEKVTKTYHNIVFEIVGGVEIEKISRADYRNEVIPEGKKRAVLSYDKEGYDKLLEDIAETKEAIDKIEDVVRMFELSMYERQPYRKGFKVGDLEFEIKVVEGSKSYNLKPEEYAIYQATNALPEYEKEAE
jgi:hypothetical protein